MGALGTGFDILTPSLNYLHEIKMNRVIEQLTMLKVVDVDVLTLSSKKSVPYRGYSDGQND